MTDDISLKLKVDRAFAELVDSLENGSTGKLAEYLKAAAQFHLYSWRNIFAIREQNPSATRVAGRQTWKALGRRPICRAKGMLIQVPVLPQWAYRLPPAERRYDLTPDGFRDGLVFDVADTEGDPLPEFPTVEGNPGAYLDAIKRVIERRNIVLERVALFENGALGRSKLGKIEILDSLAPSNEFQVLVHELAHESLHKVKMRQKRLRCVLETEAEAVAFIVCSVVGLRSLHISSDYIRLYNGKPRTLKGSMYRIQRTSRDIVTSLLAEVEKQFGSH
ncbi:MAG: hypothetical protein KDD69_06480 [Bdellovibrionales bacterium]|nr:hypothetical protein [Bdellovibrionales bacterium]